MKLKKKIAVVTGGNTGIGLAIAERLGQEGAVVAICGRNEERLKSSAEELKKQEIEVFQLPCDVRDRHQVDQFINQIYDHFSQVDILVNNAGAGGPNPIDESDDKPWHRIIETNLDGAYYCSRQALKYMPDEGRIVNISSVLGRFGVAGYTAYCASKHGLIGFTRALALETAPRRITVNALCPGWVETDMARLGMEAGAASGDMSYEEFRRKAINRVPLKQMIQPAEIAELVCFLVSPEAANITGQAYNICGGQVMD